MDMHYSNPDDPHNSSEYFAYLTRELAEGDYFEALRSISLLTWQEPENTRLFLPIDTIAILMLEYPKYKAQMRLQIWWQYVIPVDA